LYQGATEQLAEKTLFYEGYGLQPGRRDREGFAASGKVFGAEGVPQRLNPNSLQGIYVRPEGRTLQENKFFRNQFGPWGFASGHGFSRAAHDPADEGYLAAASISP